MKFVAVTACPSGVAHTYLSAQAFEDACKKQGVACKVETQGSIGIENTLTPEDIAEADVVVLTTDMGIKGEERFAGKRIVRVGVGDICKKSDALVSKIIAALNK